MRRPISNHWGTRIAMAILGFILASVTAEAGRSAFEAANARYETGEYLEAISGYEAVLESGEVTAAVYFNLGNACFKAGQEGRAVAALRQAEKRAPRDPDIQANLKFILAKATGRRPEDITPGRQCYLGLRPNEWGGLAMGGFWLWMGVLATGEWRPGWKKPLRIWRWTFGGGFLLMITLTLSALEQLDQTLAVVTLPEVVVRYGPVEESQSAFTLGDGTEVTVMDRKDDWLKVVDEEDRRGWVKQDGVTVWNNL